MEIGDDESVTDNKNTIQYICQSIGTELRYK